MSVAMAMRPTIIGANSKYCAKPTVKVPFKASPKSVNKAANFFPVRNTFVAPGFLEPIVRGSGKEKRWLIKIPNEMAPMR